MRVFKPHVEEDYEWINAIHDDDYEVFATLDGSSRAASWRPIAVRRVAADKNQLGLASDFPWLGGYALILRATAVTALRDILDANGETLPLTTDDGVDLFVFNARVIPHALDLKRSDVQFIPGTERIMALKGPTFVKVAIDGADIFRVPHRGTSTYVSDLFVERVHAAGLRGLRFDEVWSSPNYALFQFFAGYFHQDCFDDGLTPDGIIDRYLSETKRDRGYVVRLADLIERYASERDDVSLERDLLQELGCYYAAQPNARAWMQHVARRLRAGS